MVGTQWEGDRVFHALVEKLLDENDNPQHNYSREQFPWQHLRRSSRGTYFLVTML